MSAISRSRLHYLDALRAFCMLFGLIVHGSTIESNALFEGIQSISNLFRMATFFLISGYFTAMAFERSPGVAQFASGRFYLIGVPLLASLIVIAPIGNWLNSIWFNGFMPFPDYLRGGWRSMTNGTAVWHLHLWFLFSLIIFACLTPIALKAAQSGFGQRIITLYLNRTGRLSLICTCILTGLLSVALRAVNDQILRPHVADGPFQWIVMASMHNLSFFALGVIAFSNSRFFLVLHQLSFTSLALFGIVYGLTPYLEDDLPRGLYKLIYYVSQVGFSVAIIAALINLFNRYISKSHHILTLFTKSSYSFYLFHYVYIFFIANLMLSVTSNSYLIFGMILITGYPFLLWFHLRIISGNPVLSRLFNGKGMPIITSSKLVN